MNGDSNDMADASTGNPFDSGGETSADGDETPRSLSSDGDPVDGSGSESDASAPTSTPTPTPTPTDPDPDPDTGTGTGTDPDTGTSTDASTGTPTDTSPPNPSTGTTKTTSDGEAPENENGSCRTSVSDMGDTSAFGSESGETGSSGGILSRGKLSYTALAAFGVLTIFCLIIAYVVLRTILSHGMIHAPTHLWVAFYVAFLTPIAVAIGGARVVSIVSTADEMSPDKRQEKTSQTDGGK